MCWTCACVFGWRMVYAPSYVIIHTYIQYMSVSVYVGWRGGVGWGLCICVGICVCVCLKVTPLSSAVGLFLSPSLICCFCLQPLSLTHDSTLHALAQLCISTQSHT